MFSSFWSGFLRRDLAIKDARKSLYSFRHSFKDALREIGAEDHVQNALMGHAESGTGRRYGTKRKPPPVPIAMLDGVVQKIEWRFLAGLTPPEL
jgi:integrase